MPSRIGYLATDLQSDSSRFAVQELRALEGACSPVVAFSLRLPDRKRSGSRIQSDWVYGDGARVIIGFLHQFERHPLRTLAVLGIALRDLVAGTFRSPFERAQTLVHAVAGLSLSPRLEHEGIVHLHVHCPHAAATVGMYAARGAKIGFSVTSNASEDFVGASLLREKIARACSFITTPEAHRRFLDEKLEELVAAAAQRRPIGLSVTTALNALAHVVGRTRLGRLGHHAAS
jgi:hypothetical protein